MYLLHGIGGNEKEEWTRQGVANVILDNLNSLAVALVVCLFAVTASTAPLRVLFLGDNAGHKSTNRFALMQPALAPHGIELSVLTRGKPP